MSTSQTPSTIRPWLPGLCLALALSCGPGGPKAQTVADLADAADVSARSLALERARKAVVGVQVLAVDDARSNRNLGQMRQGSGVVIGSDDLVLTIGYLVLEADQVQLVIDDERSVPARVVGYDLATGFGLVKALAPLKLAPAPLGRSDHLAPQSALMIASGGDDPAVSAAQLVARRPFSGSWEYHIEGALFTAPARRDHSGAGLFNAAGELVGIGSLLVADVQGGAGAAGPARRPGNMFVPIELLLPILGEMRSQGRSAASQRAWIGINCVEADGDVRIVRVNDDSPADVAGLQAGDQILRIDGQPVHALGGLWQSLWRGGPAEREVTLDIRRGSQAQTLKVYSVDRLKTLRRAQGI